MSIFAWTSTLRIALGIFDSFCELIVHVIHLVEDVTAERQDKVGARNTEEQSLTELSAFVPVYGGEYRECRVDNRVNRFKHGFDEIVIDHCEEHLDGSEDVVHFLKCLCVNLGVRTLVLPMPIFCVS